MKFSRIKYILFCFVILISCVSFSQNSIIDSLKASLKTVQADTNKLKTFIELSKQYRDLSGHGDALLYAQQAQQLSEKLLLASTSSEEIYFLKKNQALSFNYG